MQMRKGAATVYKSGSMELSMRENGKTIRQRVEVLSGMLKVMYM